MKKEPMMMRGMKYSQFQVLPAASFVCRREGDEQKTGRKTHSSCCRNTLTPSSNTWQGLGRECSGLGEWQDPQQTCLPWPHSTFLEAALELSKDQGQLALLVSAQPRGKAKEFAPGSQRLP